jgi:hypothetical protein
MSCALFTACADQPPTVAAPAPTAPAHAIVAAVDSAPSVTPVVAWNAELLRIVRTPNAQPATIHATRSFAMMHVAMFDAVAAIDRAHRPLLVRVVPRAAATPDAAAAAAAHDVLGALYPTALGDLDEMLAGELVRMPDAAARAEGVRIGRSVAAAVIAARRADGADQPPPPFAFRDEPGRYRPTPPNLPPQPVFTHWGRVTPFVLPSAGRFRVPSPPSLGSGAYRAAVDEVRALGVAGGTAATADQALTGRFWNGPIQNYWNEIAQDVATRRGLSTAESARLFALLDLAIADGVIAFYDAKYTFALWRPVSAVRAAAAGDSAWLPLVTTTPSDPSYPGAHAVVSAAAAQVLADVLGSDHYDVRVTSEVMPGTTRTFERFSAAADEASRSRVFAGVHFSFDLDAGARLGRQIARFVDGRVARTSGRASHAGSTE